MSEQRPDANDVLMGGGSAPPARFTSPGDTVGGKIVAKPRAHQEREYDPRNPGGGKPKFFDSGDPIMGLTVDVQTALRDPSVENDTGVRRIWIEGKRLKDAVRDAVRATGAPGLEVGGELHITFTGLGEAANASVSPPKLYTARYVPAAQAPTEIPAASADPWATHATATVPTAPAAPAAPATPPAASAGVDPAVAAALANLTPAQKAALGIPA
jgi:hypothetical protein